MTEDSNAEQSLDAFRRQHPNASFVDACFVDVTGNIRGKRIPMDEAAKIWTSGINIPYSIYFLNVRGGCDDPCGMGESDGDPDGKGVAVEGTLKPVPWVTPNGAQVLMRLTETDGSFTWTDPRTVAESMLAGLNAMSLRPVVAFELEFYLFDAQPGADGQPQPARFTPDGLREAGTNVYDFASLNARAPFFLKVKEACAIQGINASVVTSEFAPGQYEINLAHSDDPIAAADECVLFRRLIQSVAASCGMRASFMAKPFVEQTGSGMHLHMSMLDSAGENIFGIGTGEDPAEPMRHVIGGLLELLPASMAFFAPNVNAWRRFVADSFVPMNRSWGFNNRAVACRIPASASDAMRVEHRVAGADANPYLVLASILAGAQHGLRNQVDPGDPAGDRVGDIEDPVMPKGFEASIELMRNDPNLTALFDKRFTELYAETKLLETENFHAVMSTKEYDWYL